MPIARFTGVALLLSLAGSSLLPTVHSPTHSPAHAATLRLEEVGSDSTSFDVVSTLIVGPTESILWDGQYHLADAQRMADRIAATKTKLKAIIISHPDHDHYSGVAVIVARFPGTPVYMTAKALAVYDTTAPRGFQNEKSRRPAILPDSLIRPQVLPTTHFTVDGQPVEVIPDLTGDVVTPTNSMLVIPSLKAVLAGDIVFNGVHAWLGSSSEASRADWRSALEMIAQRHPDIVVAGHKKDISAPDTPHQVAIMLAYLKDFEDLRKSSTSAEAFGNAMLARYPDHAVKGLLLYSARTAFASR